MQIKLDKNGYIQAYATIGGIGGGVDIEDAPQEIDWDSIDWSQTNADEPVDYSSGVSGLIEQLEQIPSEELPGYKFDLETHELMPDEEKLSSIRELKKSNSVSQSDPLTDVMLAIAELDTQRETDKADIQLAIAELAEIILGGGISG